MYQKKAELDMCIPFMYEKSKSFANLVMETSPNVVIIVDADMKIMEYSAVGEKYFGKTRAEALQMYLYEFIDRRISSGCSIPTRISWQKVHYPEFKLDTLQNIVYIEKEDAVLATFIDITREEEQLREEYEKKLKELNVSSEVKAALKEALDQFPRKRDQHQTRQDGRNAGKINRGVSQEHRFMMNSVLCYLFFISGIKISC